MWTDLLLKEQTWVLFRHQSTSLHSSSLSLSFSCLMCREVRGHRFNQTQHCFLHLFVFRFNGRFYFIQSVFYFRSKPSTK